MSVFVGTSGYNYPEWRGTFYPEKFPARKMLPYYAERFNSVEVNYTFYRIPTAALLEGWSRQTPERFAFTLKAPRRITHDARLRHCEDLTRSFCSTAQALDSKLGVLLFQLPPTFKRDDSTLAEFLNLLPNGTRAAFEFRHPSWHDDAVFEALRSRGVALCVADSEKMSTPLVTTASYTYFRLRDEGYDEAAIRRWADTVREQSGDRDAFVYFKHEEQGKGPAFARTFIDAVNG
ncbi:MAG TPA: DUF72 domain-containing protein [Vicinamibacterales bacterium]|jgi:uncharacterized protein YecE (DUF72 family)|nr:DUF72 domain-containing protein [Vicinamibacterales bacterium]